MTRLGKFVIAAAATGIVVLMGTYLIDTHRCQRLNYEQLGYSFPETWLINSKQCMAAAKAVRLRSYAREIATD
jgi:hypothetical protein